MHSGFNSSGARAICVGMLVAMCVAGCDDDSTDDPIDGSPPDAILDLDALIDATTDAGADGAPPAADAAPPMPDARPPLVPDEQPTPGEVAPTGIDDLSAAAPDGTARAGRVDDAAELITGPEASCRLGDFRLDNSRVAFCIQSERSYGQFTFAGGNLVDAVHADRTDGDYFREVIHGPGLGEVSVESMGIVRDGSDGGPAILRTEGIADGALLIQGVLAGSFVPPPLPVVTEYRLAPDSSTLEILTWIAGIETPGAVRLADLIYFGDQTRPFPEDLALGDSPPFLAAEGRGITYGWFGDGPISLFPLVGLDLPVVATQSEQYVLAAGDRVLLRRQLVVGTDVESVRQPGPDAVEITLVGPPGLRIDLLDAEGTVATRALFGPDGRRVVRLAIGDWTIRAHDWPGGPFEQALAVAEPVEVALEPPAPARLVIDARDGEGAGIAVQVDLTGSASRRDFVVDQRTFDLPAGAWTVTTTRGWHYTVDVQPVELVAGEETRLDVVLTEVIPPDGYAAGEFHQHASPSIDSEVAVADRVRANMASGVQYMVPSDHDIIYDYAGLTARMGYADRLMVPLPGVEMSPTVAHIGAYGLPYQPMGGAGGAPSLPVKDDGRWRIRTIPELIAEARQRGARLIQVNHGRDDSGLFRHSGFSAEIPVADLPADRFTTDFDSMEINNRNSDTCQLLADWMGLLNQGLRVTAVGNSDTHNLGSPPGYPRNYVPAADPARVTGDEIVGGVLSGHVTVGAGAVIDFPDGPYPGDDVTADDDILPIRVRVRTPPYAAIQRLLVMVNGAVALEVPVDSAIDDIVDFDGLVEVPVPADGHVVFLALGDDSLQFVRPGRPVYALANPIFVDRDGGGYAAPGPGALAPLDLPFCQ